MRGFFNSNGLSLKMQDEDIAKSEIECIIDAYNRPKVVVKVVDTVVNKGKSRWTELPGFHIESAPPRESFDICKEIHIFIDKKVQHQIFYGYDPEAKCGFFESRSAYDRIDISYFNPDKHKNRQ
jgi:hypothetical protein